MDTSRVDGVKAPQHRGTPRSHQVESFIKGNVREVAVPVAADRGEQASVMRRGPGDVRIV
mgnify:CR=1 FL=1